MEHTMDGWSYRRGDDGSMDTVIHVTCPRGHDAGDVRISTETAAEYRSPKTGGLGRRFSNLVEDHCGEEECTECTELDLWDIDEETVESLGISVPPWIDSEITPATVAAILQGGCDSGAYMPAVTYFDALQTMSQYGDDVLQSIDDATGEIPLPSNGVVSWAGMACYFLSMAVELWAAGAEEEIRDAIRS